MAEETPEEKKAREALKAEADTAKPDDGSQRSGLSKIRDKITRKKGDNDE